VEALGFQASTTLLVEGADAEHGSVTTPNPIPNKKRTAHLNQTTNVNR
jgi:hypothetical protein